MNAPRRFPSAVSGALCVLVVWIAPAGPALGQDRAGDDTIQLEAVEVVGSRIKKAEMEGQSPVVSMSREDLETTGITSIGDILQRLSVSSSSLNTKFNSSGNFGFPASGGGVGAGSTTVSLRHLGANRVLVLVDGLRWINESSASGVSGAVDLNTIPISVVERVEILTDGASSLYGSDAIAGVVNIVTKKDQEGGALRIYGGDYSVGDGATQTANVTIGGTANRLRFIMDLSYYDQQQISSSDFDQASVPVPRTGVAFGSSGTPTTRSVFIEPTNDTQGGLCPLIDTDGDMVGDTALCDITANGTAAGPGFVHAFPTDFHQFVGSVDRFNFAPFNLLLTPSERTGVFSQVHYELADGVNAYLKGLYQARESVNRAAPEPIFVGPASGTGGLADTVSVDASNIYNPFGFTLDANTNFIFAGRRPLEGGPRIFTQNVETRYFAGGLQGSFSPMRRQYFWDLNFISSRNRAEQRVQGTYNIAHIKRALGPDAECTGSPDGCVPLNFFGGPGTILQDQLDYISFIELDRSNQSLDAWSANVSGDIVPLPAGALDFAFGLEHRRLAASYSPDSVVTAGETNGVPSLPTSGNYSVDEAYLELHVPVVAGARGAQRLDLSLATRFSDYSTFGNTDNTKFGLRWEPTSELTARVTFAEGFRAPSVGELFGSPARFDATITDPCNMAPPGSQTEANCLALGVPTPSTFEQANTQISVRTGGNINLEPETADSLTTSFVYSPAWAENTGWSNRLDFELTFYKHEIEDAIQAPDAQTQLNRCVASGDPNSVFCTGITRGTTGDINSFNNTLRNLGTIETRGFDTIIDWAGPALALGRIGATWQTTYVTEYSAVSTDTGLPEPRAVGIEVTDSAIPRVRSNLRLKWALETIDAGWTLRYISALKEFCDQDRIDLGACNNAAEGTNRFGSVVYHDVRAAWKLPGGFGATLAAGVNNVLDKDPPVCVTCSLNGYDASVYDLPGTFAYVEASTRF